MRFAAVVSAVALGLAIGACTERPQTASARKVDQAPFSTASGAYTAAGWKAGDQASWERQITARAQSGQNEYSRVGAR